MTSKTSLFTLLILSTAALWLPACKKADKSTQAATGTAALSSDEQKVSYGIGYNMATDMARQDAFTVDQAAFKAGIEDGLTATPMKLETSVIQAAFQAVQQRMSAAAAETAEKQLVVGTEYLEKNKARPGVTVTASGLQYEVMTSGSGPKPTVSDSVEVKYHGTLIDGTVFDSSVDRGDTATFPVTQVIPGWTEALQLMSVGDKWKLFVPANLAYGTAGRPGIPGNAVLIFEVELVAIK